MDDLDRITVRALASLRKVQVVKEDLLDITADGIIDDGEKPKLEQIIKDLDELMEVSQNLKVWAERNL